MRNYTAAVLSLGALDFLATPLLQAFSANEAVMAFKPQLTRALNTLFRWFQVSC